MNVILNVETVPPKMGQNSLTGSFNHSDKNTREDSQTDKYNTVFISV